MKYSLLLLIAFIIPISYFVVNQYMLGNWANVILVLLICGLALAFRFGMDGIFIMALIVGFFIGYIKMALGSWVAYLLVDFLIASAITFWFLECLKNRLPIFPRTPLTRPIVLLIVYCLFELLNPMSPLLRSLAGLRSWVFYILLYFAGFYSFKSIRQMRLIYSILIILGVITAIYGIWQWYNPELIAGSGGYFAEYAESMRWTGAQGFILRPWSTFVMPGTFGSNMALVILIALSMLITQGTRLIFKILLIFCIGLMWAGLLVSGSRSPFVDLILGITVILFLMGRANISISIIIIIITIISVIGALYFLGFFILERFTTIFSFQEFVLKWAGPLQRGLRIAFKNPLGVGMGYTSGIPGFTSISVFKDLPTTSIDSGLGVAAAELGIPGFVIFVYFIFKIAIESLKTWKNTSSKQLRYLLLAPVSFCVIIAVTSVISAISASLPKSIYQWFLIGMLMKARYLPTPESEDDSINKNQDFLTHKVPYKHFDENT
jgi:hypothetical protein